MLARLLTATAAALAFAAPVHACAAPKASAAYLGRVDAALRAGTDLWGNRVLARPGGPTYAAAARYLPPLLYARGPGGKPLTPSGVYYLAFGTPDGPRGAPRVALHVADGSEILSRSVDGPALTVSAGGERYGSCLARLEPARLAQGWLPILETGYRDSAGTRLRQESFTARAASYVRLTASRRTTLQIGAARTTGRSLLVAWSGHGPSRIVTAAQYEGARAATIAFWRTAVAPAATIAVPEPRVENAYRALLVQELTLTWRYSVGNPYEEFSFPEGVDVAQVLAEVGLADAAKSILRTSFTRAPVPYPSWKKGERLLGVAEVARLGDDAAFLGASTPVLRSFLAALERSFDGRLLAPERYSSDIPNEVYGLHGQAVTWAGLEAIATEWAAHGHAALAKRARSLATRLGAGLRAAVRRSERRLPDGSLFLPAALLSDEQPYDRVTSERLGSYWNLVMPYALASGLLSKAQLRGAWRYMRLHGSRLLGLVRVGGYALYGRTPPYPVSGTDEVYGINVARFLGDLGQAAQLDLSLYGDLAAAMTPATFVAGEAASVSPLAGERDRAMYLPPNGAANAAFLETLRQLLVHETARRLDIAPATPPAWLGPGKHIAVSGLPTSFGPLSYSLTSTSRGIEITVDVPSRRPPATLTIHLRTPGGSRTVVVRGRRGRVELVARP